MAMGQRDRLVARHYCHFFIIICVKKKVSVEEMKHRSDNKEHWFSNKEKKSRELVYKLIDINKEIDGEGKTFRLGGKVYFVRELG
jgi:hypothetical protein